MSRQRSSRWRWWRRMCWPMPPSRWVPAASPCWPRPCSCRSPGPRRAMPGACGPSAAGCWAPWAFWPCASGWRRASAGVPCRGSRCCRPALPMRPIAASTASAAITICSAVAWVAAPASAATGRAQGPPQRASTVCSTASAPPVTWRGAPRAMRAGRCGPAPPATAPRGPPQAALAVTPKKASLMMRVRSMKLRCRKSSKRCSSPWAIAVLTLRSSRSSLISSRNWSARAAWRRP